MQFQPLTADFLDIPNHKSMLESVMRTRFTTMTKGDIVGITFGGQTYNVAVVDVKPQKAGYHAVNLVNTDCAVDFLPPLNLGAKDTRQASEIVPVDGDAVAACVAVCARACESWAAMPDALAAGP